LNTFRIIGLTILALLSISPMVTASSPHKPVLTTQLFTQPVQFSAWNLTSSCGTVTTLFNFTITLSGKDPGSLWIDFRPFLVNFQGSTNQENVADVFNSTNIPDLGCASFAGVFPTLVFIAPSGDANWHVLQSGNYTAVTGFSTPTPTAEESWTVTTIS
jgi:hypothetical protein